THYDALALPLSATAAQIKTKFYALSKKFHPDRTLLLPPQERTHARRKFEAISQAYAVLGNTESKKKYDLTLRDNSTISEQSTYYRQPGEKRKGFSGLNRTRERMGSEYNKKTHRSGASHPINPFNVGLGGGYATGLNDDVPHFDFQKHVKQQQAYELFRNER
ncbi:hypothetical protein V1514DRAFT_267158, partial [Lipomyces japonicus]|uniref:uncharacterized protein n=1 Tax=Lipomyces japonicus TaxID=56871 RepID=UPI0034CD984F